MSSISDSIDAIIHYLTSSTVLVIPNPRSGFSWLWYTASIKDPHSWMFAGKDYVSTHHFIGDEGIWDATGILLGYGFEGDKVVSAASYEHAVLDRLIHYSVNLSKLIPNIHALVIDDIV